MLKMRAIIKQARTYLKKLKKNVTKDYYQNKLKLYENSIKNTWKVMKEITGKKKRKNNTFPKKENCWTNRIKQHSAYSWWF